MRCIKIKSIVLIAFIALYLIDIFSFLPSIDSTNALLGKPAISTIQVDLTKCEITQILEDESYLYLLTREFKETVFVYSLDGLFQYSITFHSPTLNGFVKMARDGKTICVSDSVRNLYIIKEGSFSSFISYPDNETIYNRLQFDKNSGEHLLFREDICKIEANKYIKIIDRPCLSIIYQYNLDLWIILLFSFLLVEVLIRSSKKRFF